MLFPPFPLEETPNQKLDYISECNIDPPSEVRMCNLALAELVR